jgi:hypothetical protein
VDVDAAGAATPGAGGRSAWAVARRVGGGAVQHVGDDRVILGVQWTAVAQTGSVAMWTLVLGLPAFLAGATVTRLLAVLHLVFRQRRAQATRPSGRACR